MEKKPIDKQPGRDLEILKIFFVLVVLTITLVYGVQRILEPKVPEGAAPAAAGVAPSGP